MTSWFRMELVVLEPRTIEFASLVGGCGAVSHLQKLKLKLYLLQ